MKYVCDDGKVYEDIYDAEKHDKELKEAADKKKQLTEEKNKRLKEVEDAFDKFEELYKAYIEDYHSDYKWSTYLNDLFDSIMG